MSNPPQYQVPVPPGLVNAPQAPGYHPPVTYAPPPPPPQYSSYQAPQPWQQPRAYQPPPPQQIARVPVAPVQVQVPVTPQLAQQQMMAPTLPWSTLGWYGYTPDAMWNAVASVPPIFRRQEAGETFGMRFAKNVGLVIAETVFRELFLAARQATLPPPPRPPDFIDAQK